MSRVITAVPPAPAVALAVVLAVAACGSRDSRTARIPADLPRLSQTPPGATASPRTTPAPSRPAVPRVGITQHVDVAGAHLAVTIKRVLDPLLGSGAALLAHTRAVGVLVEIVSTGPAVYDSSATGDFSIGLTAGAASPAFASQGVCKTPLRDFDNYITEGEYRSGCVVFQVASGARPRSVSFSPHGGRVGRLTWAVSG